MTQLNKLQEKILRKPIPSDITWDEIKRFLEGLGFEMKVNKGSRRKFYNAEKNILISCHEPHPQSIVNRSTIKDIVLELTLIGII
jgi:predicted RNA binding protein YcfA (HicA-like mRNA interferase family)